MLHIWHHMHNAGNQNNLQVEMTGVDATKAGKGISPILTCVTELSTAQICIGIPLCSRLIRSMDNVISWRLPCCVVCWRFRPDAFRILSTANETTHSIRPVETFVTAVA